jgi:hypothetical protein
MKDVSVPLLRWVEQQRAMYVHHLTMMENKVMKVGEYRNGEMVDTTDETTRDLRDRIEKLDVLLEAYRKPP